MDTRPASILRAVALGREIQDLNEKRAVQMVQVKYQVDILDSLDRRLTEAWIEVGKLRSENA